MSKFSFFRDLDYEEVSKNEIVSNYFVNGDYKLSDGTYIFDFQHLGNYFEYRLSQDLAATSLIDFKVRNKSYKQFLIKLFLSANVYVDLFYIEPLENFSRITVAIDSAGNELQNSRIRIYRERSLILKRELKFKGLHVGDRFDGVVEIKDIRVFTGIESPLRWH